jgi:hypothetical protein
VIRNNGKNNRSAKNHHNITIIDGESADIETIDNTILMETGGVATAIDKLRESLDKVESHLDNRQFEKASHAGYQDVAYNFVYVQRTLAGLQTLTSQYARRFQGSDG